jgi:hypothetical protein
MVKIPENNFITTSERQWDEVLNCKQGPWRFSRYLFISEKHDIPEGFTNRGMNFKLEAKTCYYEVLSWGDEFFERNKYKRTN